MPKPPIAAQRLATTTTADKLSKAKADTEAATKPPVESMSPSRERQATEKAGTDAVASAPITARDGTVAGIGTAAGLADERISSKRPDEESRDADGHDDDPPGGFVIKSPAGAMRSELDDAVGNAVDEYGERPDNTLEGLRQEFADLPMSPAGALREELGSSFTEGIDDGAPETGTPSVAAGFMDKIFPDVTKLGGQTYDDGEGVKAGSSSARDNNPGLARVVDHTLIGQREGAEFLRDESSTKTGKDGTVVIKGSDGSTTVIKDEVSTTVHKDGTIVETTNGKTTVITPGEGEETNSAKQPGPDDEYAPLPDELQQMIDADLAHLRAIGPQPAPGGGVTDPVEGDDLAFGMGSGPVQDLKETLLGGDHRFEDARTGSPTAVGAVPARGGGFTDPTDDDIGPAVRGPEDDPIAGQQQPLKPDADTDGADTTDDSSSDDWSDDASSSLFPISTADVLSDSIDLVPDSIDLMPDRFAPFADD